MTFAYAYYVDGFAKIGHTIDIDKRLSQLIWDRPIGVSAKAGGGEYVATYKLPTKRDAMLTEQVAQDLLHPFVVRDQSRSRGGRCEWFKVPAEEAAAALQEAAAWKTVTFELSVREYQACARYKRAHGAPSVPAVIREAVAEYLARNRVAKNH